MLRFAAAALAIGAALQSTAAPHHAPTHPPTSRPPQHGHPYVIVPQSSIDAALASPKPKPSKKPKPKPSSTVEVFGVYKN
jgi:hypothetical protein